MTAGVVLGLIAVAALAAALPFGTSRSVKRRIPTQRRTVIFGLVCGAGFALLFRSAQDLRSGLGFWAAYGATYGPVLVMFLIGGLIMRSHRGGPAPEPLWKWTQGV